MLYMQLRSLAVERYTPLLISTKRGKIGVIKILFQKGANPNACLPGGITPLFLAAQLGDLAAVLSLLPKGALARTVVSRSGGMVPLDAAAENGHADVVAELLNWFGIDQCAGASGGRLALNKASEGGHNDTVCTLLEAGVSDVGGEALCFSIKSGKEAVVQALLASRKYNVWSNTSLGYSAVTSCMELASAEENFNTRIVRRVMDVDASDKKWINACESFGSTKTARHFIIQRKAAYATSWLWPAQGEVMVRTTKRLATTPVWKRAPTQCPPPLLAGLIR